MPPNSVRFSVVFGLPVRFGLECRMTSPHSGGQRAFAAHPALMALACCLLGGGFLKGHTAQAQDGRPAELPRPGYRELAPGVLTVIPPTSPADMSAANVFRQQ